MPNRLKTKAQARFSLILRVVARARPMACGTSAGSPRIKAMPAVSMATSVPVAMARPRSAAAKAGASLTPSPTIATLAPSAFSACDGMGLVIRQQIGANIVEAQFGGDLGGCPFIVARQHQGFDAQGVERLDRRPGAGPQLIGKGEESDEPRCLWRRLGQIGNTGALGLPNVGRRRRQAALASTRSSCIILRRAQGCMVPADRGRDTAPGDHARPRPRLGNDVVFGCMAQGIRQGEHGTDLPADAVAICRAACLVFVPRQSVQSPAGVACLRSGFTRSCRKRRW